MLCIKFIVSRFTHIYKQQLSTCEHFRIFNISKKQILPSNMGLPPIGSKEIDRLLVPPGKASTLLTDHLITGQLLRSEPV